MFGSSPGHSHDVIIPPDGLTPLNSELRIPEGGFALLSTVPQNASLAHVITALTFDPYQELLWTGNSMGRVVSFYGAELEKYTAFLSATNSDVRALLASETAVFSLTQKHLKADRRQGISLFTHTSDHMTDLTCMHRLPDVPHKLLLGGNQQQIIQFDLETQKEIRIVSVKQKNCLALRSNQKFLFSSDSEGNVTLRHLTSVDPIHALQAHQGAVADFDVCGNKLITCGFSPRLGKMTGDRFIMIYDMRTLRSLPPVPLPMAPSYCRFLPSYSDGRIMVCSQIGEFIVMDLNEQSTQIPIQLDTNGFAITALDVSSSKQCISFGDQTGFIHLFSDRMEPIFNDNSWGTEFPDPVSIHPPVNIDDPEPSYGVFPLPFPTDDHYASDWPEQLCVRRFRQPDPIPLKVIESMRMVQFVGYAHNPRASTKLRGFNVCPYTSSSHDKSVSVIKNDGLFRIPKFYLLAEGRQVSKADEIDSKRYNRTAFNTLEYSTLSSPANMILLAMYHLISLRSVFLSHLCYVEGCISCEINLLFRLLTDRPVPSVVSAKNFMKTFRSINDGKKWVDATANTNLSESVHLFMQVFSKVLDKELSETAAGVTLRRELEISFILTNRCFRCAEHYQSALTQLYISFVYPTNNEKIGFCKLLEKTLNCPEQNEIICQKCGKLARVASTRRVRILPNILAVDLTTSTEIEPVFWVSQLQEFETRPPATPNLVLEQKQKYCRYGNECKNSTCRYIHNDDPTARLYLEELFLSKTTSCICKGCVQFIYSKLETAASTFDDTVSDSEWHHFIPSSLYIKLTDGICTVSEHKSGKSTSYQLRAATFLITQAEERESKEHLVTAVRTQQDNQWKLFNHWSVTQISKHEALHLDASWKVPVILYFEQSGKTNDKEAAEIEKRAVIPKSVFWNDFDSNKIKIPEKESKVVIHAKYVFSQIGEKLVYEVCGIDENDNCFINSRAKRMGVVVDGNSLLSLKRLSLKLLYLVQENVTIIGYKINELFEILNIYVPKEQMKDIVSLSQSSFKRESVEEERTDVIDLARLSLRLYEKFNELKVADEVDVCNIALTQSLKKDHA
ncbi:unnamed protein product [Thelazia callipaeda]|uniref:UCH_1 domain-containing protein n=1 Tax=Thelazia callipaeda TaxID=103827 RepID=A0A0N5CNA1_THECL|nr:unnamed protein product [Thelazia callipaeda]